MTSDRLDTYLRSARTRHIDELLEFVAIPTVSALPEHQPQMNEGAEWIAGTLARAGAPDVTLHQTDGSPIVIGSWPPPRGAPTILIYGHYDVQPADPIDQWTTPPFEPTVRDNRVYGRGASDDKGNLLIPIRACEALTATNGSPPCGVTVLIEGEEEIGSPNLRAFLETQRSALQIDAVFSADSVMWAHDAPSLTLGGKGLLALDVTVRAADSDLHSGLYGGLLPNAALTLAQLLASMVDVDGTVTVDGFEPHAPHDQSEVIESAPFDLDGLLTTTGAKRPWGDARFHPLERNWFRPTLEVNGITAGFSGQGPKTIIPARAQAKLSCRLVPGQDPLEVAAVLEAHIRGHCSDAVDVSITRHPGHSSAFTIQRESPPLQAVRLAIGSVYEKPPLEIYLGATLPFAALVRDVLDQPAVMLGWSMPDENLHAPDEFFRLENLDRGVRVYAETLMRLAEQQRAAPAQPQST